MKSFELGGRNDDGKGRCPFDPAQSYTSVMVGKYKIQLFLRLFISGDRIHRGACSSFIPEFIFRLLLGDDLHAHALKLCFYFPEFKQWFDIDHKSFVNRGSFCVRSIYLKHFKEVAPCPHIQMCHCSIPAFEDITYVFSFNLRFCFGNTKIF